MMFACVDVHYDEPHATAACLLFDSWSAPEPVATTVTEIDQVAEYEPGEFYRRELPCLLKVLRSSDAGEIETIIVDGYVWLGDDEERQMHGDFRVPTLLRQVDHLCRGL